MDVMGTIAGHCSRDSGGDDGSKCMVQGRGGNFKIRKPHSNQYSQVISGFLKCFFFMAASECESFPSGPLGQSFIPQIKKKGLVQNTRTCSKILFSFS